jgi:hypothetical protein
MTLKNVLTLRLSPVSLPTHFVTMTVVVEATSEQPAISTRNAYQKQILRSLVTMLLNITASIRNCIREETFTD